MENDIEKFLYQFIDLPKNIISIFKETLSYSEIAPLDFFIKTNEYPTDFLIIKTGLIRSYLETEDGKEITRNFFTPGQVASSLSAVIKEVPSELNYQALTKVTGYKANFLKFKELTLKHHELSLLYIKTLEDSYLKVENIILDISINPSTKRYLLLKERIPNIDNLISQRHIASYLNITPVQLSRIKKKLLTS